MTEQDMTDQSLKSLYARMSADDAGESAIDVDRLARLAAGEVHASGADVELLASNPAAAAAYQVARGARADAHALSAAIAPKRQAVRPVRRPVWPVALAASVALFAVLFAVRPGLTPVADGDGGVAHQPAAEPTPLFSGSFEPRMASVPKSDQGAIFGGSFDNG